MSTQDQLPDESWMHRGMCRETPELFFSTDRTEQAEAKRICRRCPVIATCLAHCIENPAFGIWGGTTETERRRKGYKVEPKRLSPLPICGTANGYHLHRAHGEKACPECLHAMNLEVAWRQRRAAS